ncbi:MAG: HNH endonuclease [Planctomycetaceae bacterium]
MASASPGEIIAAILRAIEESGYSGTYLGRSPRQHPRRFAIALPDGPISVDVYIWTLTPGGRPQLPHEYRIQMTSVTSPLALNPDGPTVLLGYYPDLGLFAGFDLSRHRQFTPGSSSVQIDIRVVREALRTGLSFDRKSNAEIAIGIHPDQLVQYIANAEPLHRYGRFPNTLRLLNRAAEGRPITRAATRGQPTARRWIVEEISRLSREARFRRTVLQAYDRRCAVTRAQLRLVDAAHILPVGVPESSDDVSNGIALSPTYHRAYDAGLIFLDERYVMRINPAKVATLRQLHLDGGLQGFQEHLGRVHLPPDERQWPHIENIRQANRYREVG